jgi:NTE family protein
MTEDQLEQEALGWLADCMDQQLFNLARNPAIRELRHTPQDLQFYGGLATMIFMLGWATGGIIFGIMGDRVGRAKTVVWAPMFHVPERPYDLEIAAVDSLRPGEVFVMAVGRSETIVPWGELLSTATLARGGRGAVLDGLVRDSTRIKAMKLPSNWHPLHAAIHTLTHTLPPNMLNPLHYNPLRDLLKRVVDFDRINRDRGAPHLFLNATNVRSGKLKVFETPHVTPDAVLASACLPPYFQAVEIDGEHYWDGGYLGNPAIYPLIYRAGSNDVIIAQVTAIRRDELPASAADVLLRITEISFNSSLMREMRAVDFATRLIDSGELDGRKHRRMFMHWIGNDPLMAELGTETQFQPEWSLLCRLRDAGRDTAKAWLDANFEHIGTRSTVNFAEMFL